MCLSSIYTDEDMNRIVEELPEVAPGVVEVFKVVCVVNEQYHALNFHESFVSGMNYAKQPFVEAKCNTKYYAGFHFWSKMEDSTDTGRRMPFVSTSEGMLVDLALHKNIIATHIGVVSCIVKKEWFTAVGKCEYAGSVLVTSQAFFPAYPETEAKLEDFLAWLNEPVLEMAK